MRDSVLSALVAGLGSMALFCLFLWAGLSVAGIDPASHERWFGGAFIPLVLLLRFYAKTKNHLTATRTLIVLLFVTFAAFMYLMIKSNGLYNK